MSSTGLDKVFLEFKLGQRGSKSQKPSKAHLIPDPREKKDSSAEFLSNDESVSDLNDSDWFSDGNISSSNQSKT